jgi:phage FluMu protein Com
MIEKQICPHCDGLIDIEYSNDYYLTEQGEVFAEVACPKCEQIIQLDWELRHVIYARRKE